MSMFPNLFASSLKALALCVLCLGILASCGRTRPMQAPPMTETFPPVVESQPDSTQPILEIDNGERIRQIHEQLFKQAQHYFDGRKFQEAIRNLSKLLALHPQAGLEREGRWLLGQAYDQVKDWESARREYGILASASIDQRYQDTAAQRFQEIQGLLEKFDAAPQETQAIRFALNQLPATEGFDQGIQKMKQDGVTTLLIDLGCQRRALSVVSSQESLSPLVELQAFLRNYAQRIHSVGLLMYVGVNLRCLGHWAPSQHQVWQDLTYQIATRTSSPSKKFDLFHPAYQEFLIRFLIRLCNEGVDGLVFLNDHPLGMYDGVTRIGVRRFEKQFGVSFDPARIFHEGFDPIKNSKRSKGTSRVKEANQKNTLFWRWAGWKARERLTILEAVVGRLRSQYPSVQFGLELHPHGLTDPVGALVEYGEDAMDATGRPFSFFFVRPEIDRRSTFTEQAVVEKLRRISTKAVLDRLLPAVDNPRRVWVSMPAKGGQRLRQQAASGEHSPLHDFPSGIGVVHDLRAFS